MADMPYVCVSSGAMWQLSWVLHQSQGQADALPDVHACKAYVKGRLYRLANQIFIVKYQLGTGYFII